MAQRIKTQSDLSKARIQLADREIALAESRNQFQNDLDEMKNELDLAPDTPIAVRYDAPYKPQPLDWKKLVAEALTNRLDLVDTRLELAKRRLELDQARRRAFYDLELSGTDVRRDLAFVPRLLLRSFDARAGLAADAFTIRRTARRRRNTLGRQPRHW